MAQRLPRFAGRFDDMDLNRDGVVSLRELEQFLQADGDMEEPIQADAKAAARSAGAAAQPAPQVEGAGSNQRDASGPHGNGEGGDVEIPPVIKKDFIRVDANGDGFLSPAEVRGHLPAVERNFSGIDTNGDGRISLDELWQFRRKMFAGKPPR